MRRLILFLAAAFALSPCSAQIVTNKVDDQQSALYRGRVSRQYSRDFNGTPFWDNSGFMTGSIIFNGKLYENVLLNIDAAQGEVNVKFADASFPVSPDRNQVPFFIKGSQPFVNLRYLGVTEAEEGFYEIIYDGEDAILKRVDKTWHKDAGDHRRAIGYDDPGYNPDILAYYESATAFWYFSDGKLSKLSGKRSLLGHYKDRKKEIKKAIASTGLQTYGVETGRMYASLMTLIEGSARKEGKLAKASSVWHESEASRIHIDVPSVGAQVLRAPMKEELPIEFFRVEKPSGLAEGDGGESVKALYQNKVY
ncbi:MAG: hypothetical protein IK076_06800, partial [Bacteroidales bacterium]|nr:hypothetical protein [Bacteroidales bacterium]